MRMQPMKMQQNQQTTQPLIPGSSMPQGSSPWNNGSYASRNFFVYECDTLAALGPGLGANLTFNIAGDSDFFWTKFAAFALVGGVGTTRLNDQLAAVTLLIVNTTTGRQYSSTPSPIPNICGTGELPFILPQITMWQRKSTIQVQLQNVGNQTYSNVYLSFMGIKAFPVAGAGN
jgi:hypothetical protein